MAAESAVRVGIGLQVDRDAVGAGVGECLHLLGGTLDHEMHVQDSPCGVHVVGDRRGDERADRDRRDEVAVHDVDVDDPRARCHHVAHLRAELGEVGGEDRRGDPAS